MEREKKIETLDSLKRAIKYKPSYYIFLKSPYTGLDLPILFKKKTNQIDLV
jgi:hypothetical protein